ncbi:hypothetical protein ACET3Z_006417 [Daucus carota]
MLSPFLQAFHEPRWKLEMVMQCIRKYVAKRYMNPVLLRKLHHMRTRTRFNKLSGMEPDNATEESGADQYHRVLINVYFEEDIDLMAKLNFDAYRFSLSWPRGLFVTCFRKMELVLLTGRELCLLHQIDRLHASERW